jgi:hypothetical protein
MTMWDYRNDLAADTDFVGYDVQANDGGIGKIDEASNEAGRAYLVVDTGFWIFGKKRLIPAGVVERVDHANQTVYLRMSKDEVKAAPDFNDSDRDAHDDYDTYYESYRA